MCKKVSMNAKCNERTASRLLLGEIVIFMMGSIPSSGRITNAPAPSSQRRLLVDERINMRTRMYE
jgi:hypothetical protein